MCFVNVFHIEIHFEFVLAHRCQIALQQDGRPINYQSLQKFTELPLPNFGAHPLAAKFNLTIPNLYPTPIIASSSLSSTSKYSKLTSQSQPTSVKGSQKSAQAQTPTYRSSPPDEVNAPDLFEGLGLNSMDDSSTLKSKSSSQVGEQEPISILDNGAPSPATNAVPSKALVSITEDTKVDSAEKESKIKSSQPFDAHTQVFRIDNKIYHNTHCLKAATAQLL